MQALANFVAGKLRPAASGRGFDVFEPAVARVHARAPDSDATDVDEAVRAAQAAFPAWRDTPAAERARWLHRIADLVECDLEAFAEAESRDSGKPLSLARSLDIPRAVSNLRFFAAAATQFASESHAMEGGAVNYTLRQPLGAVGCISPWNLPLYLFTWKIAPALAAGNTVVAKPSEVTPLTAAMLAERCIEAGLPDGVLNIVHGGGAVGAAIVEHPGIKAVTFTGGTETGRRIAAAAAGSFKKLTLELGGKNPTIVFGDCDFAAAVDGAVRAAFANQGEICLCGSRVLVERSLYPRFRDAFVERVRALRVGDPLEPATDQGALVSERHLQNVLAAVERARAEGGTVLCGGARAAVASERCRDGWFMQPTVIEDLPAESATNQEEIFGPVATLLPFETESEAIAIANGTEYGLAASLWSRDVQRCHRVAAALESGLVWINTWMLRDLRVPMGGMKSSGLGREGGWEAMRFFTEPKNVCVKY
ncbi:MAG TPA: aldehyde dehydrogenase [Woeseiaceae bacterium]|nr:aldehyde dehydrogenase [Woeseiaceae bacterium]